MQFDQVASQDPSLENPFGSQTDLIPQDVDATEAPDAADASDAAGASDAIGPRREGLPRAFQMRHGRHYVEQLMGDAPLRTVREIPVSEIDPPPADDLNLEELQRSIREVGVLEPLLVSLQDGQYQVISGANRLRAAVGAGLRTVPCLVHDVDRAMLTSLREEVRRRIAPPGEVDVVESPSEPEVQQEPPRGGFGDMTAGLAFVSALVPALEAAGDDQVRAAVVSDLIAVELRRVKTFAAATEILSHDRLPDEREDVDAGTLVARVVEALRPDMRVREVRIEAVAADPHYAVSGNAETITTAVMALIYSLMLPVHGGGSDLRVHVRGTTVRPALIVDITQRSFTLDGGAASRFFDEQWQQHPCGPTGALMLAAAARVARLHGGRADLIPAQEGTAVTFVVPRPYAADQK